MRNLTFMHIMFSVCLSSKTDLVMHKQQNPNKYLANEKYWVSGENRGKKITCPGARDKLNFRQDKHIFSPNVLRTSKKFTDPCQGQVIW